MHGTAVLAAASLLSVASPARAEFPAAVSAWVGVGLGSGDREEVAASGTFGLAGLEAAWRFRRGRALVATYESSGGPGGQSYIPESPHFHELDHVALTIGPEFSFPPGSGVAFFCRGSIGAGRVTTDAYRGMPPFGAVGSLPLARLAETGFAFSGAGGLRLVPPPGPLGFTLALHGARTIARHSRCGAMGVTFGMTLYPLDRRRAAPAAH